MATDAVPYTLAELLPHGEGMILLDHLISEVPHGLLARVAITPASRFLAAHGEVPVWIGLEYMAQTIAAHVGLRRRRQGQPVAIGFLLGSRRCLCYVDGFAVGRELTIGVEAEFDNGTFAGYACSVRDARTQEDLMIASMSVYQPEPPPGGTATMAEG